MRVFSETTLNPSHPGCPLMTGALPTSHHDLAGNLSEMQSSAFPRALVSREPRAARLLVGLRDAVIFHPIAVAMVDYIISNLLRNCVPNRG